MTIREELLGYAQSVESFTAGDAAEDLGINPNTARAQVLDLVGAGAIKKVGIRQGFKGRPQNVYEAMERSEWTITPTEDGLGIRVRAIFNRVFEGK